MLEFAVRLLFVLRRRLTREYFCATLERIFAVRIGVTASSADGASSMRLRQCDRPSADDTNGGGKNGTPPVFSVDQSYLISKSSGVDGSLREKRSFTIRAPFIPNTVGHVESGSCHYLCRCSVIYLICMYIRKNLLIVSWAYTKRLCVAHKYPAISCSTQLQYFSDVKFYSPFHITRNHRPVLYGDNLQYHYHRTYDFLTHFKLSTTRIDS